MTAESEEPMMGTLVLICFALLAAILIMVFAKWGPGIMRDACTATVNQANPDVIQGFMDKIGVRPLKWLCETLLG